MADQCTIRGLQGTLRLSSDALELVSGEVVSVRVPLCVLCGARPDVQVLVQFSVIYHDQGRNLSFDVRCGTALAAQAWVDRIRAALGARRSARQPHVLLVVNPVAGQGRARAVVASAVVPVLEASGATVEVRETERVGHAEEMVRKARLQDYDTIAVVSGDGAVHEVVNGLLSRPDAEAVSSQVDLAIIPSGSGNALAASLGMSTVDTAVWSIAQGATRALDVAAFWQQGRRRFLFINMLFAILCDVDFFSEPLRALGEARFTLQGIWEILRYRSRTYRVKLQLLAADHIVQEECLEADCTRCAPPSPLKVPEVFREEACEGFTWRTVEDFVPFFACQNSKLVSASTKTCPYAHLSDGTLDVCLLRGASRPSRLDLVRVLLSMDAGDHLAALPKLEYYKVKALRFTPLWEGGRLGVDGEHQPFVPLDVRVCEGGLRLVRRPGPVSAVSGLPSAGPRVPFGWLGAGLAALLAALFLGRRAAA